MGLVKKTDDEPVSFQKDTPDTPPKRPRGRPKGSTNAEKINNTPSPSQAKETKQIEETLARILTMPGIIFALQGDDFCAKHYEDTAPELAKQLATASLRYPQLRKYFLGVPSASENLALFAAILAYLYAPIAHHVPGIPRLPALQILGVPVPPEDDEPPVDDPQNPNEIQLTRSQVIEALIVEKEGKETLTVEAENLIREQGFGDLLDERDSTVDSSAEPTFGPDGP